MNNNDTRDIQQVEMHCGSSQHTAPRWLVFALLTVISGCASTGIARLGATTYPAKPADCHIEVFASAAGVKRPYHSVCMISSEAGSTLFNNRSMPGRIKAVKADACRCGADAIIIKNMEETSTKFGRGYGHAKVLADAIVFKQTK